MSVMGGRRTLAFYTIEMLRIAAHEVVNLSQPRWKRLSSAFRAWRVEEAKTRDPQGTNFCPLFGVCLLRNFERSPHPVEVATALRTLSRGLLSQLPRLAAFETGVGPAAIGSTVIGRYIKMINLTVSQAAPEFHSLCFGSAGHS